MTNSRRSRESLVSRWNDEHYSGDLFDELVKHFDAADLDDWIDVGHEARRLYNGLFDEEIEEDSGIDCVMSAASAAAYDAAIAAVARMLGCPAKTLGHAIGPWEDRKDGQFPPAIPLDGLPAVIAESEQWLSDLDAGKFDHLDDASGGNL